MLHWFAKRLRAMQEVPRDERGFTLIELLVVVIIIGILAAIAIPIFLNQRQSANQAACESDVRNGTQAATAFAADHNGSYVGMVFNDGAGGTNGLEDDYDWNLSAQSSNAQVLGPGFAGNPTANGYSLRVTCTGGTDPTASFDSATGRVTSP